MLVNNILGGTGEVILDGLTLTPSSALTVRDVDRPVIIRGVTMLAQSTALGLYTTRCPKVALQRVTNRSRSQFYSSTVHAWNGTLGRVELQQSTRFVHASTTTTAIVPDGTSSATNRTGPTAMLDAPLAWPSTGSQSLTVHGGGPGDLFGVLVGAPNDYFDLSPFVPFDMVLLLSLNNLSVLPGALLDASGGAAFVMPGPSSSSSVGYALQFQLFTLNPTTAQGRLAELRQLVMLR